MARGVRVVRVVRTWCIFLHFQLVFVFWWSEEMGIRGT